MSDTPRDRTLADAARATPTLRPRDQDRVRFFVDPGGEIVQHYGVVVFADAAVRAIIPIVYAADKDVPLNAPQPAYGRRPQ